MRSTTLRAGLSMAAATGVLIGLVAPTTAASAAPSDLAPAAITLQAENATISQGVVEANHAGFTGTGFVNYNNVTGSSVQFSVTAAQAGATPVTFRYANGTTANRPMDIAVNGTVAAAGESFPGTGAWTTWSTRTVSLTLNAGTNTVRATATTANGGPNLDKIDVDDGSGGDTQPPTTPANLAVTGTTSNSISLSWNASSDNVGVTGYRVYEGSAIMASPAGTSATISGLAPSSSHTYTVAARDAAGNESGRSAPVTAATRHGPPGGCASTPP